MFKKLSLTILFSVSLCAAEPLNCLTPYAPIPTHSFTTGDLIATLLMAVIIPNMLRECLKRDEEKNDYKARIAACLLVGVDIALLVYQIAKYEATEKAIYDYWHPK